MASRTPAGRDLLSELQHEIGFGQTYFALVAASCAIATLGLLENSAAVIIGAMLIAPLMTPIVALALGIITGRMPAMRDALVALVCGAALAIAFSATLAALFKLPIPGSEILGRSKPDLLDLGIALAAGAIAGYARIRTGIAGTIGGAAIAVALMPPLCVVGIGIAMGDWTLSEGALMLFATNLVGITMACALVFAGSGLATKRARGGLATTTILLVLIAIPLAYASTQLLAQQQLEVGLRSSLLDETQTFKRVQLVSTDINWLVDPVRIRLFVRTQSVITSTQVGFLQAFAERALRTKRAVRLSVDVTPITTVEAPRSPPAP